MSIREQQQQRIDKVIEALGKVSDNTKTLVYQIAQNMAELEIIQMFNQLTLDFLDIMLRITREKREEDKFKIGGYKTIFDNAIKINIKMPIDQYTLVILRFAAEIYSEDEDCFLNMPIPDTKLEVGNQFSFIRSDMFKNLWRTLKDGDKSDIKNKMILLTTYAHAYLYKTVIKNRNQSN